MEWYAIAQMAQRGNETIIKPAMTWAHSREEAIGQGMTWAREDWPIEDGWYNHSVSTMSIPREAIQFVAEQHRKEDK